MYPSVGWEPPGAEQVKRALENTLACFAAYDGDRIVGMVRLIGDGDLKRGRAQTTAPGCSK